MRYSFEELFSVPSPVAPATPAPQPADADAEASADDRLTSEIIEGARAKLKATKHPERKAIIKAVLSGKPFAEAGERDRALQKVASWLAWGDPDGDPEVLAEVLRPSLEAMEAEHPDDFLTFEDAVKKIDRAQSDARRAREDEAAQNAGVRKALERGLALGSSAASQPIDVEIVPSPSQIAPLQKAPHVSATATGDSSVPSPAEASPQGSLSPASTILTTLVSTENRKLTLPEQHLGRPYYTFEEMGDFRIAQEKICGRPISPDIWKRRWVIQAGEFFYVHGTKGYLKAIPRGSLAVSLPRDLSPLPEEYFSWQTMAAEGVYRPKVPAEVLSDLATVAREVVASMMVSKSYYDDETQTFYEVSCPLRVLEPVFDEEIDHWLRLLGGDTADKLLDWLATITDMTRPSCALMITGVKDAGKSMLAVGASRLWTRHGFTNMAEVFSNWTEDMMKCPLVVADENLPENFAGKPVSTKALRDLISSDRRPLHRKFQPNATLLGALRVMLLANNDDMLTLGEHENLGPDALAAVAGRFLHIRAPKEAAEFLARLGGRSYTQSRGWVDGDLIAKHLVWLKQNRAVVPGNRFLVEGQLSEMHKKLAVQGTYASSVTEFLAWFLNKPDGNRAIQQSKAVFIGDGYLWANGPALAANWEELIVSKKGAPALRYINEALGGMSPDRDQIRRLITLKGGAEYRRYWRINPDYVIRWATDHGVGDAETMRKNLEAFSRLKAVEGDEEGKSEIVSGTPPAKAPSELVTALLSKQK